MKSPMSLTGQFSALAVVVGFAAGGVSTGLVSGYYMAAIKQNALNFETHLERGPHDGVPAAILLIQKDIKELKVMYAMGTDDRYRRSDAVKDREHFCTANPALECPDLF